MKLIKTLALGAALLVSSWVQALTVTPYSADALAKAQAAGEPVALHFHADWCPTCRAQDQALEVLKSDAGLNIVVLKVDYDKEVDLKRRLKVRSQSTFIVYRGKTETNRQIGATAPEAIRAALRSAL